METSAPTETSLRPLGLGEMLDRAVTLTVRNFPIFALIWIVFAIPMGILQYFGTADQSKFFGMLADMLKQQSQTGHSDPGALAQAMANQSAFSGWTAAYIFMALLLTPLPSAALIAAIGAFYLGRRIGFAAAYRAALGRYFPLLLFNLMWLLSAGALYIVLILVVLAVVFVGVAFSFALHGPGVAIAAVLGIAFFFVILAVIFVLVLAYEVGFFACVLERRDFVAAFVAGLQRVFSRLGFWRALKVGLAYVAIAIGLWIVTLTGQAVVYGFLQSHPLALAYTTVLSIVSVAFITSFTAVFYFDLRVREEGLDLQLAAQDMV